VSRRETLQQRDRGVRLGAFARGFLWQIPGQHQRDGGEVQAGVFQRPLEPVRIEQVAHPRMAGREAGEAGACRDFNHVAKSPGIGAALVLHIPGVGFCSETKGNGGHGIGHVGFAFHR
jgi:hypothetical protein